MDTNALVLVHNPPAPANEAARLEALERYRILDTPPDEAFESIVDLATATFQAPIGLITFLNRSRQWFKARRGVSISESARRFSFCAHTILSPGGLVVRNTLDDPTFRYNPFVTGSPFMRFYAGAPLVTKDGYPIGSLGVADIKPRADFGPREFRLLEQLAGLVMDQAELRLTQAHLRTEKHKLEFALKNAGMGHWSWDVGADGRFELPATLASLVARRAVRLDLDAHPAPRDFLEFVHVHDRSQVRRAFTRLRDDGEPLASIFRFVLDEEIFWVEVFADYAPDSDTLIIGTARDVTERERWRSKSIRTDRLHALSSLGAGVAHEINNPLSVISTNLYLLSTWFERNRELVSPKEREYVSKLISMARRGSERVEGIVESMLELSRPEETGDEQSDPCSVLDSVLRLLQSDVPPGCNVETHIEKAPAVRGRPSVLAQVFVNLLLNAIDAVERVSAEGDGSTISVSCQPRGPARVAIEIRDSGPGLAADERAQIFNPFFTTKPPGQGTGLGLAIAHSIIDSLGGDIAVESERGRGTTVRVTLPAARRPQAGPSDDMRPVVH